VRYPFQKHFLVCNGERCNHADRGDQGGQAIRDELKELNKKLGRKTTVRICSVSCLDLCDFGPNMIVEPEGIVYSHLDREKARRVYCGVMHDGPPAPEFELSEDELRGAKK
jgi:(2Fe-2S) ferredoxin